MEKNPLVTPYYIVVHRRGRKSSSGGLFIPVCRFLDLIDTYLVGLPLYELSE